MSNWQPSQSTIYSPYAPPSSGFPPPPPPRRNQSLWLLAVGAIAVFLCCGGVALVMWYGMGEIERQVAGELRNNPKLQEQLGEIESMDMDVVASGKIEDNDTFVYRVKGSKASGRLTVKHVTDDDWNEKVVEATLRLNDGTEVQIVP